jgi:hypothetical protein
MPKKERYQINMRVKKEFKEEVMKYTNKHNKPIIEVFTEGFKLYRDKHRKEQK